MTESHPVVERYLTRLSDSLTELAPLDRQEVMQDIRSHLAEATAAGKSLDAVIQSLGPADALARAYAVELLLNPREKSRAHRDRLLKIAALVAAGSIPTLIVIVVLGGVGLSFIAGGVLIAVACVIEIYGELPSYVEMRGVAPRLTMLIGIAFAVVGVFALIGLKRFVRFVALTWRALVPKGP